MAEAESTETAKGRSCDGTWQYEDVLNAIAEHVRTRSSAPEYTDNFTPHDYGHCTAVQKIVDDLIRKGNIDLTPFEAFLVRACVLTHDLGMLDQIAKDYMQRLDEPYDPLRKRSVHEQISAWYIANEPNFHELFSRRGVQEPTLQSIVHTISIINRFHRRKEDVAQCPEFRTAIGQVVRTRLLACLVRLGDTLHVDSSRYDRKYYNVLLLGSFDRSARLHWLKSYLISSLFLDEVRQEIVLTIDLPEPRKEQTTRATDLEENAARLQSIVRDDILEDVRAVTPTMKKHFKGPFFSSVRVVVNYCQGFSDDRRGDVMGVLYDLSIVMSPNTSKVISKAIDCTLALLNTKFDSFEHLFNETRMLRDQMLQFHAKRPCHVGLGRIAELVDQHFAAIDKEVSKHLRKGSGRSLKNITSGFANKHTKILREKVEAIRNTFSASRAAIRQKADKVLVKFDCVYLFGYSEMVLDLISGVSSPGYRENTRVFVFECAGKRQLSVGNDIEYNDGMHYALAVSRIGFKRISLLPDSSFGSVLRLNARGALDRKYRAVLLIGANGLENGSHSRSSGKKPCAAHSSGHLMMAIAAKHFKVPVFLIADSLKRGRIDWSELTQERAGVNWFSGEQRLADTLSDKNITLVNYRSDMIEPNEYTLLIDEKT